MKNRVIRSPHGAAISAKSWLTEAPIRMLMNNLDPNSMANPTIPRINYEWVDLKDGLLSGEKCNNAIKVPYIRGTEPKTIPSSRRKCRKSEDTYTSDILEKLRGVFSRLF